MGISGGIGKQLVKSIFIRDTIYRNNQYIPWQPGFELFAKEYHGKIITGESALAGIVAYIYYNSSNNFNISFW